MLNDIGPRYCPICRQKMKKEEQLGFFKALEVQLGKILWYGLQETKWACTNDSAFENKEGIQRWERKYKSQLNKLKKEFGDSCVKYIEKHGFNGDKNELRKKYGRGLKNKVQNIAYNVNKKTKGEIIKIPKKPPERVCCYNNYKYKVSGIYNESKKVRKKDLLFIYSEDAGRMIKYKSWAERLIFPGS